MRYVFAAILFIASLDLAFNREFPGYPGPGHVLVCVDNNRAVGQCHLERQKTHRLIDSQ